MFKAPRISFSVLAALDSGRDLANVLKTMESNSIDFLHCDVSEHEKTLKIEDLHRVRSMSTLPLDIHIWLQDPTPILDQLKTNESDCIAIHAENDWSPERVGALKARFGCRIGLALNVESSDELLDAYVGQIDYVLFMGATAGVSGGQFDERVLGKIQRFRSRFPHVNIHADGGINQTAAAALREMGVDLLVSGSFLLKTEHHQQAMERLFGRSLLSPVSENPFIRIAHPAVSPLAAVSEIARSIQDHHLGCTAVVSEAGEFLGLITDGDLRRALIRGLKPDSLTAKSLMNPNPYCAKPEMTVLEVLRQMENENRYHPCVPIVDSRRTFNGVVNLLDLLFAHARRSNAK